MTNSLFRQEVLNAQKTRWTGAIILTRPVSFVFLTLCVAGIAVALMAFGVWGEYTKRSTVQGQLIPEQGLIQSHAMTSGTVIDRRVIEGQSVNRGDVLFRISTAHLGDDGSTQQAINAQLELKRQLINHEIEQVKSVQKQELNAILHNIDKLKADILRLDAQIKIKQEQVRLSQTNLQRYQEAHKEFAVSEEEVNQKQREHLIHIEGVSALEREKQALNKQINDYQISLDKTKQEHGVVTTQLQKSLSDNKQADIQNKSSEILVISAAADGVVGTVNAQTGQFVEPSQILASILPKDSELIAQMYVPSRSIGFIKVGDEILLRYQAFAYQKFGHAKAKVISIAKVPMAGQEIPSIGTVSPNEQLGNEPLYIVRASLDRQFVQAYGENLPLQSGMLLEGDILHEMRKLYEWVLEPLYSITGKFRYNQ